MIVRGGMLAVALLALTGCDGGKWERGGWPVPITVQGKTILRLWEGSLLAALLVGGFVLFLILFACVWYRKRGNTLPRQVRYNLPVEITYTIVPMVIVAILFYFTAVDESYQNKLTKNPDVTIGVVGFQWSWQFNYEGQNLQVTGRPGSPPTLVLPIGKTVRFVETSPDVIHAFWVIPFLFKRDVIPGRENQFEVTLDKTGTFAGKCTELCGVDHDRMLFTLKSVSYSDYLAYLQQGRALAASGTNPMFAMTTNGPYAANAGAGVGSAVSSGRIGSPAVPINAGSTP